MKPPTLWPGMIFGLLGVNATIVGITLYLAYTDRSFAVEPEYYQKALKWDQAARERERSRGLGWSVAVDPGAVGAAGRHVSVSIRDRGGSPVSGARVRVEAFSALRAADRIGCELEQAEPGVYRADMAIDRPGAWEFKVRATRGPDSFIQDVRVDVRGGRP